MTHGQLYPMCTLPRCNNLPWLSKNLQQAMKKRNKRIQGCVKQDYTYIKKLQAVILCKKHQQWRNILEDNEVSQKEQSTIPVRWQMC